MVDVSGKAKQLRQAKAKGKIYIKEEVIDLIKKGKLLKGNVYEIAKTAGILSAKNTPFIIPLCHNINIDHVDIKFEIGRDYIEVTSVVKATERTGVEMEALTSTAITLLVIYDMCKPHDKQMRITDIRLVEKIKK
jgi:cyclic pyranopterin phosphate synthase